MGELYTIGHSQHNIEYFIKMLRKYDINYILDVRSTPYSKYAEQYNRENIEKYISCNGMKYSFMGKFFGARPRKKELYCADGYLDFERVRKTETFIKGFNNVMLGLQRGYSIVLMCTEKDPFDCHRAIMVARAFDLAGIEVKHILADGTLQHQSLLNQRLLNKYFPERDQIDFFSYLNKTDIIDYVSKAYQLRNKEIGYHLEEKPYGQPGID